MSILIVFGSLLGKTKRIAVLIGTELKKAGFDVKVKDVRDTQIEELKTPDYVILGSSTWDDGMVQYDFRDFHKKLMKSKFPGKKYAVFGLGSKKYPHFCTAADILSTGMKVAGGAQVIENLKLNLDHDEPMDKCDKEVKEWAKHFSNSIIQ